MAPGLFQRALLYRLAGKDGHFLSIPLKYTFIFFLLFFLSSAHPLLSSTYSLHVLTLAVLFGQNKTAEDLHHNAHFL